MKLIIFVLIVLVVVVSVVSYRVPSSLSSLSSLSLLKRTSSYNKLYSSDIDKDDLWYERVQYVDLNAQVEPSSTARPLPLFLLGILLLFIIYD